MYSIPKSREGPHCRNLPHVTLEESSARIDVCVPRCPPRPVWLNSLFAMTTRLYYHDSFLYDFDAEIQDVLNGPRPAVILDRTAFYPTSGGQVFDTGWLTSEANSKVRVSEVADAEDGRVIHYVEALSNDLKPGNKVRGQIDAA